MRTLRVSSRHRAFTMLELVTACAGLVVILGLTVSLARYVRSNASLSAAREQLADLDRHLALKGMPQDLPMFAEGMTLQDEQEMPETIRVMARQNADRWATHFGLPASACFDPWGMPIVLIRKAHPNLGMAPRLRPFLMTAGPDNKYFTLADDIYSYELTQLRGSAGGGHPE